IVFCSLIASSAIRAFISALKLRRCLDFISAPFPRQRFYTLLTGPNFGEHFTCRTPHSRNQSDNFNRSRVNVPNTRFSLRFSPRASTHSTQAVMLFLCTSKPQQQG